MKALVAMSGGVDSSVAAALVLEAGYEVVGVTLKQWQGAHGEMPVTGCCTVADAEDARSAARVLDIPYYVLDQVEEFTRAVVDHFGREYLAGRTPNPCIECNRRVRFGALFDRMRTLDCDVLVTGHHARVAGPAGARRLLKATDPSKDQSYVLHMLGQEQLERVRLPVGEITKDEVRAQATRLGLRTATKPDSQDLCFVAGDYRDFVRQRFAQADSPGDIVDLDGAVVGRHSGAADFTIGQRRGLGVAAGEPRYVVSVEPESRRVVIGSRDDLSSDGCVLEQVSWVSGSPPADDRVEVKVRYRSAPVPARVEPAEPGWRVWFDEPLEAVAPGQAGVLYRGDEVLGGGTIAAAVRGARS